MTKEHKESIQNYCKNVCKSDKCEPTCVFAKIKERDKK